jgi:pyridoxamine 5'-phosphate oxidase
MSHESVSKLDLAAMRKDYARAALDEAGVARDPIVQFERWLAEAVAAGCPEPTAMSLATVAANGQPSSRIVLLKGVEQGGLIFFTNYQSRKGEEMVANPHAALLFFWVELEREVRIEGVVEKVDSATSDAYFHSRPVLSRISALVSPQSKVVASRAALEQSFGEAAKEHGEHPPRPPHWGGYRLVPQGFEFWQGRRSRLHDRIAFAKAADAWEISRLAP